MHQLSRIIQKLIAAGVEFVLVGGYAAVVHGSPLGTKDVDICCAFTMENLKRVQTALEEFHPVHRARPDMALDVTPELCAGLKNLYLKTDIGVLDCLGNVLGVGDYDEVRKHSIAMEMPVGICRVLDLDTLIVAKEAIHREHDLLTVKHLKAIKNKLSPS